MGSNRAGDRIVYVQPKSGGLFRLKLANSCTALDVARRLTVRGDGNYWVCSGDSATLVLYTGAGQKRCAVDEVRRLSPTEMAELATSARR